jgi:hypothetical protein
MVELIGEAALRSTPATVTTVDDEILRMDVASNLADESFEQLLQEWVSCDQHLREESNALAHPTIDATRKRIRYTTRPSR